MSLCIVGLLIVLFSGQTIINRAYDQSADKQSSSLEKKNSSQRAAARKQDPNDIDHAPLYKIGQYYNSARYGRIKLTGISTKRNVVYTRNQLITTINWAKICTNTPKTAAQRINSASDYNLDKVSNPYTYLKVQYTVQNNFSNAVTFGGVRQLTIGNGSILNGTDELVIDDGQSEQLLPHTKRVFTIHVLIDKFTDRAHPQKVHLYFGSSKGTVTLRKVAAGFDCLLPITYDRSADDSV